MATETTWLEEFLTNLNTDERQTNPRVVGLANGNFLVVWEDDNDTVADGVNTDIVGVIFNALGEPITDTLYLNELIANSVSEELMSIAARPDGGFIVVFRSRTGSDTDLYLSMVEANGDITFSRRFVSDDSFNGLTYDNARIAVSPDGSFFVTFQRDDGSNQEIVGQKFDAEGNFSGGLQELRLDGFAGVLDGEDIFENRTVALSDGRFATVFTENDTNVVTGLEERTVELRFTNADGTNGILITNVSTANNAPDTNPRVIELADGRVMVAWQESDNIRGRIFNASGTESVSEFNITNNPNLDFRLFDIVALEDGGYYTLMRDETIGRLVGVRGTDGSQDGSTLVLSVDAGGSDGMITEASASLTTDGRILISFRNTEIYTEIRDPRDVNAPIDADIGDGQITGLQQDSTIYGSSSAETIYGVAGNDTILGFGGNDTIDGGIGDDTMYGGQGNDSYYVDSLNDAVYEFAGEGRDKVFTSVKINTLLPGWENIEIFELSGPEDTLLGNDFATTLIANQNLGSKIFALGGNDALFGSGFNDRLNGGLGDDFLFGLAGNDRLDGGSGADRMEGGDGNDRYFVDDLLDTVAEAVDEGIDQVRSSVGWTLGDNVENLRLRGAANIGIGNELDNVIQTVASGSFLSGLDGNDNLRGSQGADTILGGNDNDTINGRAGNDDLRGGKGDDDVRGRSGEDHLQGGAGNDLLNGGKDNDLIEGGSGQDTLKGEGGADTFKWSDGDFAGITALTADRVLDFNQGQLDKIDLSDVDANTGTASDDAFTYIGNAEFTGTAGELRWESDGLNTMIYMDVNGNGLADYAIRLDGDVLLTPLDFVL